MTAYTVKIPIDPPYILGPVFDEQAARNLANHHSCSVELTIQVLQDDIVIAEYFNGLEKHAN